MGSQGSVLDESGCTTVDLSHACVTFDEKFRHKAPPSNMEECVDFLGQTSGLRSMFEIYPDIKAEDFFAQTLPFIIKCAAALPELLPPEQTLKKLVQGRRDRLAISRDLAASLLAHMFLCTINEKDDDSIQSRAMPDVSFISLHSCNKLCPQEVAKLRMFVNYFERIRAEPPRGQIRIYRQVRDSLPEDGDMVDKWSSSSQALLEIDMVDMYIGFENVEKGEGCLHADFANMFLGGGVLSGGCVQEEIRFSICPELCAAMVVCPCMLENEAITIVGGEQFSEYSGYAFRLKYAGDFRRPAPQDADGTPLVAITAMDALDLRGADSSLQGQMELKNELRELEKAAAAFEPVDEEALKIWPIIATGNWGCGAFGGSIPLKAVLQWLAASQGGRSLRYFPFDAPIGPELAQLSKELCAAHVTVGHLFSALRALEPSKVCESQLLTMLKTKTLAIARHAVGSTETKAEAKAEAKLKGKGSQQ